MFAVSGRVPLPTLSNRGIKAVPSATGLTNLREQWIQKICAGIAASVGHHALLDPARIAGNPSDQDLLRTLLILRIAVLDARGRSTTHITGLLEKHPVFGAPKPDTHQLTSLVGHVRRHVKRDGLVGTVLLFGAGLRAESPESTYDLLLEHWTSRLNRGTAAAQEAREVAQHWARRLAPERLRRLLQPRLLTRTATPSGPS